MMLPFADIGEQRLRERIMSNDNHRGPIDYTRAFAIGVALNIGFVAAEAFFGVLSGSLALLADAGHNLSDVLGLFMAWGASYISQRKATVRRTYGWRKTTILAAVLNAVILLVAIGGIAWEAIRRFNNPAPVAGKTIIWVAAAGVAINTVTALLFMTGWKKDLNIRGAFLHMAADAGVSAGVVLAGFGIFLTGRLWIDPVVSLVIVTIILFGTWGLLRDSVNLALDAVPRDINPEAVETYLSRLPGVKEVHDLHIWGMSTTETALTAHLVKPDVTGDDAIISKASRELRDRFGIDHVTLQWERKEDACCCDVSCRLNGMNQR
jgi:cobalt-zinc-cadmium efflux system protein